MKLIKLTDVKGNDVYINPEYVRLVEQNYALENVTTVSMIGAFINVSGNADEVANKIVHGYQV